MAAKSKCGGHPVRCYIRTGISIYVYIFFRELALIEIVKLSHFYTEVCIFMTKVPTQFATVYFSYLL